MRKFLLVLGVMALVCSPAMAGKNAGGALVVHTDDAVNWTGTICDMFDAVVPQDCADLNTRTDKDDYTAALIWFIAAFDVGASPGVTVAYFGNDHNLPQYYHNRWGFCANGMAGSIEVPDTGWPDFPLDAGNSVAWGSPILGDTFFPVYYFDVWGFSGAYYCSAKNPNGVIDGVPTPYAAYVDDSNPPATDYIECFGCVNWYQSGYNDCPPCGAPPVGACCFDTGDCTLTEGAAACADAGGYEYLGDGTVCEPNPCDQQEACCFDDGTCQDLIADLCYAAGGIPQGEDTDCATTDCPLPPEACCFPDGSCEDLDPDTCTDQGGVPYGVGTECATTDCPPPPTEACCFDNGDCQDLDPGDCTDAGGIPQGAGTECATTDCPVQMGACCYAHEECAVLSEADCMDIPDWYLWIPDEDCEPNPCPPVATETTTWGSIKSNYR